MLRQNISLEFVEKTRVTVKNGTLVISYKDRNARNIKNLICYITAPDLSKVKIDGVKSLLIMIAMPKAVTSINGALTIGRMPEEMAVCKTLTSLVRRVTKDEVEK